MARTWCTAEKDFNQKPWILSGLTPFQSGSDFNFLLTSSLVIFSVFCFSDSIFSFVMSFHSASCLCLTCTPYSFPKYCCIFSIQWFCPLFFTFKVFEKCSLVGLEIPVVLKLLYPVVILFYFRGFCSNSVSVCFSSSITNVNPFLLSPCFWSSQSFSFFLFFFHLPTNHAFIGFTQCRNVIQAAMKIIREEVGMKKSNAKKKKETFWKKRILTDISSNILKTIYSYALFASHVIFAVRVPVKHLIWYKALRTRL